MSEDEIRKLLQTIRNEGAKNTDTFKKFLQIFPEHGEWSDEQCQGLFRSILQHYLKDDEAMLDLMLAVSGLKDGYQSPYLTAAKRRVKYLDWLTAQKMTEITTTGALEKREKNILERIAQNLKTDFEQGKIPLLFEQWDQTKPEITHQHQQDKPEDGQGDIMPPEDVHKHKKPFYVALSTVFILVILVCVLYRPSISEIFITKDDIVLYPGKVYQLDPAFLPKTASRSQLSFVSMDTSIVTVSKSGLLLAHGNDQNASICTTEIIIQAESGATATKEVSVVTGRGSAVGAPIADINDFAINYKVEQRARIVGTDKWEQVIENAKVGDKIEFRIQYINTSDEIQQNVIIKDALPDGLRYIPGSTRLINAAYTLAIDQDTLATTGINIGHYMPGANALVDFTVEVVDDTLHDGFNTRVNWFQWGDNRIVLQDYVIVKIHK